MPTTRARHQLTETDEVARALDAAAKRWPDEPSRARLLLRLVEEGRRAIAADERDRLAARRDAIEATRGTGAGLYGPNYLEELRLDWPE